MGSAVGRGFGGVSEEKCRELGTRLAKACGFRVCSDGEDGKPVGITPPGLYGCFSYRSWRRAMGGSASETVKALPELPFLYFAIGLYDPDDSVVESLLRFEYSSPSELEIKLEAAGY